MIDSRGCVHLQGETRSVGIAGPCLLTCIASLSFAGGHNTFFEEYLISASRSGLTLVRNHLSKLIHPTVDRMMRFGCRFLLRR